MKALVLGGAGAVCSETTRDLVQYSNFDEIVIAENNLEAANELIDELGDPRLKAVQFDANDYDSMLKLFPGHDVDSPDFYITPGNHLTPMIMTRC